jgi:hypothetical protein
LEGVPTEWKSWGTETTPSWAKHRKPVGNGEAWVGRGAGARVGKEWRGGMVGKAGEEDRLD